MIKSGKQRKYMKLSIQLQCSVFILVYNIFNIYLFSFRFFNSIRLKYIYLSLSFKITTMILYLLGLLLFIYNFKRKLREKNNQTK